MDAFYAELKDRIVGKQLSQRELNKIKHELCTKHGVEKPPTNIDIYTHIPEARLVTKPMRSQSGVVPVAVMTKPAYCPHGKCTYCPGGPGSAFGDVPQSYTGNEPSTMRAIRNHYDPYLIVMNRLEQFVLLGHDPTKVELIIQGGTFPALEKDYQESVIRDCFLAMNDFGDLFYTDGGLDFSAFKEFFELPSDVRDNARKERIHQKLLRLKRKTTHPSESDSVSLPMVNKGVVEQTHETPEALTKSLKEQQRRNETTRIRCVGLTIETKPDWGLHEHGEHMLKLGCTRVELGVQTIYDKVLKATNRGHTMKETYDSFRILKDMGFKICAHLMPGLPDTTYDEDLHGMLAIFKDDRIRPDLLKIYPCQVAPGTPLYYKWKKGEFKPLDADTAAKMIAQFKNHVPEYCRIQRVLRDVPTKYWADGVEFTNLRQYIHHKYKPNCRCIRCREPKGNTIDHDNTKLREQTYKSSGGTDIFLSYDDMTNDYIVGFCRLRYPSQDRDPNSELAFIRELHVNGTATQLGDSGEVQHRGYGSKLLARAEELARDAGRKKMIVISGVGVREYYRKKGYTLERTYMVKDL